MNKEDYLAHHGVKGMKWGVRKDRFKNASRRTGQKVKSSAQNRYYKSDRAAYKRSKSMSNDELKAANKRFQLEQNYRQNVQNDRRAGQSYAENIISKSGGIFVNAAIGAAAGAGGAIVGKKLLEVMKGMSIREIMMWLGAR